MYFVVISWLIGSLSLDWLTQGWMQCNMVTHYYGVESLSIVLTSIYSMTCRIFIGFVMTVRVKSIQTELYGILDTEYPCSKGLHK